ncbi:MAG: M50 family metallopeptidase [Erythrobacter sp.]|nr:M50 family metallopeptidase [Erythrobacter sp.]
MSLVRPQSQEEQVGRLVLAGALVLFLPALPFGGYLLYPFTILTTWFHEMGHGLAAMATGNDFQQLVILPDGSGVATSDLDHDTGALTRALIAMGGPLGPSVVGAGLIMASSRHRWWRPVLLAMAAALALSTLIWVRSLTGWLVLPALAAGLAWLAWQPRAAWQLFALQFLGVLAALSMFHDWDYLFSNAAVIGGQPMLSDTGAIAAELWLPYWFWAAVIVGLSGLMVGASLKFALNREG